LATFTQKIPDQLVGAGQLFSQALSEQTRWYKQSGNSYYARQ
jgi:hypothetical protein